MALHEGNGCAEPPERLLVLAPIGRDADLIVSLARSRGFSALAATDVRHFVKEFSAGVGAVVITEEVMGSADALSIAAAVERQPAWSDVPFIVIANRSDAEARARKTVLLSKPVRNATIIERPVRPSTILAAFEAVLRDRRRQYELKAVLEAHHTAEEALRDREMVLRTALIAADLGMWRIDLRSRDLECSAPCRAIMGLPAIGPLQLSDAFDCILSEDRATLWPPIRHAILNLTEFQLQYRVRWALNNIHWVLLRGRAFRDEHGGLCMSGVAMDITERQLADEALQASERKYRELSTELERRVQDRTKELIDANREMEGFTYTVSHDLRGPLRAIAATSMILKEDYGGLLPRDAIAQLDRQSAASKKLAKLIDDLLRLSRLGRQEMRRTPVDISGLAREAVGELQTRGVPEGIRFDISPGIRAQGDPTLVRFALLNLFENAVKFSPEGGEIKLGELASDGTHTIYVQDHGIGFDQKYASKVFQPFERLVSENQFPGTGIGLANVQRIITRHGGRIWATSEPGKGTTFFFTL